MARRIGSGSAGQDSMIRAKSGSISGLLLTVLRALEGWLSQDKIGSVFAESLRGLIIPWLQVRVLPGPLYRLSAPLLATLIPVTSHSRTVLSPLPEAKTPPSELKATE